jgi:hypothetical protein
MDLTAVKAALGITRIIWIDDAFYQRSAELENLIARYPDVAAEFDELAGLIAAREFRDVDAELAEQVADMSDDRQVALRDALLAADAVRDPGEELPRDALEAVCGVLGVDPADRLAFDAGEHIIAQIGADGAADVVFVVDLKDAGGPADRGLDLLRRLDEVRFAGVTFILTHEAILPTESEQEAELTLRLADQGVTGMPVTVIAKDRLAGGDAVEETFVVALKRAGLRHALRPVLAMATQVVGSALSEVIAELLALEPERLERYVYGRGQAEGESELHVIERALTARMSRALRTFMATDDAAADATRKLRALEGVALETTAADPGDLLEKLRQAEMWDEGEVVNQALRPLANGDVFELDPAEPGVVSSEKLFVLLAQPCDVILRPKGTRDAEVGMLVPISPALPNKAPPDPQEIDVADGDKDPELPFRLLGQRYRMRLREIAYVRLSVLDLAAFRTDGRVVVEKGQVPPAGLLKGAAAVYAVRTEVAAAELAKPAPTGAPAPLADERLLLTMSDVSPWRQSRMAVHVPRVTKEGLTLRQRVTWRLRRKGRVRPPYSTFMLERVLGLLGRRAFDNDYTVEPIAPGRPAVVPRLGELPNAGQE